MEPDEKAEAVVKQLHDHVYAALQETRELAQQRLAHAVLLRLDRVETALRRAESEMWRAHKYMNALQWGAKDGRGRPVEVGATVLYDEDYGDGDVRYHEAVVTSLWLEDDELSQYFAWWSTLHPVLAENADLVTYRPTMTLVVQPAKKEG